MNLEPGTPKSKLALCAPGPLFRGTWPDGVQIVCNRCAAILAEGIAEDQIWDITFICFECQTETDSPSLPPGMALPSGTVYIPPGSYGVSGTLEVKTAVVIGERAILQYKRERNDFKPLFDESPPRLADGDLQMVVSKQIESVVRWMGGALDKIVASDRLATKSATPPKRRHPVAETMSHAHDALRSLVTDSPTVHLAVLCELSMMCSLLEHWGLHPLWPKLTKAFASEYSHSLVMLSAASLLDQNGNGVVLHEAPTARAADLLLVIGPRKKVAVEVKAPYELRWPTTKIDFKVATDVVSSALKSASTGRRGQLSPSRPGLLVIGGFGLAPEGVSCLKDAAKAELKKRTA